MKLQLAYGKHGLWIDCPDSWNVTVVSPRFVQGLANATDAIQHALEHPIASASLHNRIKLVAALHGRNPSVGVVFSDITRPTPNHIILPVLLAELAAAGVQRDDITLFNALGTHRPNTDVELRGMLGDMVVDEYRIVQNSAFDTATQVHLGLSSRGHDIWLNREMVASDIKILTGFIEPHFFAGFSGGGKAIMPGMAGLRTVLGNHDAGMIGDQNATWGVTKGNPIWEEAREVALRAGDLFLLNVALNNEKQITSVFAGDLEAAHDKGCEYVRQNAMTPVPHEYDIVVTTNSGYPLDLNLYQAVKGMCAAAQVVRHGGAIICAAECWDGIPEHGLYGQLLRAAKNPRELLDRINMPGFLEQDQWEAQVQALIQLKADVYLRSDGLSDDQITSAMLKPCHSIEATILDLVSQYALRQASICILPEGPQTVAYIA